MVYNKRLEKHKRLYLRTIILKDDISNYHQDLNKENDFIKKLRLLKNCFIALDIFRDSLRHYSELLSEHKELTEKTKRLRKQLNFINHIRNKISGHLDDRLLEKAVQWEPQIFRIEHKNNHEGILLLTYKTLLESAINSYVGKDLKQKVFNTEIDLFYPPDTTMFFNYVGDLNIDSIDFLTEISNILGEQIVFWKNDEMLEMAVKAAETDFNLKNTD